MDNIKRLDEHADYIETNLAKWEADRLKENLRWYIGYDDKLVFESDIGNLVKEMVGDKE